MASIKDITANRFVSVKERSFQRSIPDKHMVRRWNGTINFKASFSNVLAANARLERELKNHTKPILAKFKVTKPDGTVDFEATLQKVIGEYVRLEKQLGNTTVPAAETESVALLLTDSISKKNSTLIKNLLISEDIAATLDKNEAPIPAETKRPFTFLKRLCKKSA